MNFRDVSDITVPEGEVLRITDKATGVVLWEKTYTVTFDADGGTPVPEAQAVPYGELVTEPTPPTKQYHRFNYWYEPLFYMRQWNFSTDTVSCDMSLVAQWTRISHLVHFDADGGTPVPEAQTVMEGDKIPEPTAPSKDGYVFDGWYNGSTKWNFSTDIVLVNLTLKAKWTGVVYNVTFNTNGGTINSGGFDKYTHGVFRLLPTDVTRDKYDFGFWFDNAELTGSPVFAIDADETGDKEYWAKWTDHSVYKWEPLFHNEYGDVVKSDMYAAGYNYFPELEVTRPPTSEVADTPTFLNITIAQEGKTKADYTGKKWILVGMDNRGTRPVVPHYTAWQAVLS